MARRSDKEANKVRSFFGNVSVDDCPRLDVPSGSIRVEFLFQESILIPPPSVSGEEIAFFAFASRANACLPWLVDNVMYDFYVLIAPHFRMDVSEWLEGVVDVRQRFPSSCEDG